MHARLDGLRIGVEIDAAIGGGEFGGSGDLRFILCAAGEVAALELVQDVGEKIGPE